MAGSTGTVGARVGWALAAILLLAGCGSTRGTAAAAASSSTAATLSGTVVAAPACPNDRPGPDCPPRPVEGARVTALTDGSVAARTTTGADGTFLLALAPGRYTVVAERVAGLVSQVRTTVVVPLPADAPPLRLTLDSFIR